MLSKFYMRVSVVLIAGLLNQSPALALNPTGRLTVTHQVVQETCSFDDSIPTVITLPSFDLSEDIQTKRAQLKVSVTCNDMTPSVRIFARGLASEFSDLAFRNTGTAKNVALQLTDVNGNYLRPDGTGNITLILPVGGKDFAFLNVNYFISSADTVVPGTFASAFTLNFSYP